MRLYTAEFGLTELRFYTTAFMFWLSAVLLIFLPTVLAGRRDHFALGALVTGLAAILVINAVNPDAHIARTNLARLEEGKRFDAHYLTNLSADAAPVLSEALPEIGDRHLYPEYERVSPSGEEKIVKRPTLETVFLDRWTIEDPDWRAWNLSRWRADRLAGDYRRFNSLWTTYGAVSAENGSYPQHVVDRTVVAVDKRAVCNKGLT
jgi:hypothetical protein